MPEINLYQHKIECKVRRTNGNIETWHVDCLRLEDDGWTIDALYDSSYFFTGPSYGCSSIMVKTIYLNVFLDLNPNLLDNIRNFMETISMSKTIEYFA